jgi:endonuclease YncB( thermonuclease family)
LIGFIAYKAVERFPEYLGPVAAATAVQTVSGPVSHVRDGDTIEVAGTAIRFGSLDCAERDTAEGRRASAKMSELVAGHTLTCHLNGRSSYDRRIGSCRLDDGRDLAAQMISGGYCSRYW